MRCGGYLVCQCAIEAMPISRDLTHVQAQRTQHLPQLAHLQLAEATRIHARESVLGLACGERGWKPKGCAGLCSLDCSLEDLVSFGLLLGLLLCSTAPPHHMDIDIDIDMDLSTTHYHTAYSPPVL